MESASRGGRSGIPQQPGRLPGASAAASRATICASTAKAKGEQHRDIDMTLDWMDAMGVDYACLFPTPMLFLGLHPQVEIEVAMCRAYNRWLCERMLAQRAAHRLDAVPAVQRSGGRLPDGQGIRRQERRRRLHGDVAALQAGARQRLHEDLRAARGDGQADLASTPPTTGTTARCRPPTASSRSMRSASCGST